MKSKNAKKGSKNDKVKRNVQTMKKAPGKHSKEEIISEEELENRIAISGDIRLYLTMHLRIFIDGYFHHPKKKKLINLAQYIYDQKVLYINGKTIREICTKRFVPLSILLTQNETYISNLILRFFLSTYQMIFNHSIYNSPEYNFYK